MKFQNELVGEFPWKFMNFPVQIPKEFLKQHKGAESVKNNHKVPKQFLKEYSKKLSLGFPIKKKPQKNV